MPEDTAYVGITPDELRDVLDSSLTVVTDAESSGFDGLSQQMVDLNDSVNRLYQQNEEQAQEDEAEGIEEVVYTVRLDSSQVETFRTAAKVACTEGLLVCVLLALIAGLQAWRVLSGGWRNG